MSAEVVQVRPRKVRRVAFPIAGVLVVVFAVVGTLLRDTPTGAVFSVSDQVAMGLLGVLLAAGVLLLTRPRLRADANGLDVRNIIGSQHVEWELVQGITFPDGAPWARVELPEDEYIPIMAIQATDGEHAVAAMRALRELRRTIDA
ncbi:PH domain-containing protein [Saccharopolyspora rhizosphaerae]|uniref:PH domain-containing protein n=1 Tax=Saccharopolyspora rhizosphaerae TaxID=2492662 RepID=A0A426JYB8_9PSEU|nr:PH domain-containing protein [Saccharopolyspora rhizosphaerae]RRO18136.1 PH domain-containing protein [Saccharopolyspora rhizosphaerae]